MNLFLRRIATTLLFSPLYVGAQTAEPVRQPERPHVFGTASGPAVRPVPTQLTTSAQTGVDWMVSFGEPNRPGTVDRGILTTAPDGGVCAATYETLGGAASGVRVVRYGADGTEAWSAVAGAGRPLDVLALGGSCVVARRVDFVDIEITQVGVSGVAWDSEVAPPTPDSRPDRVLLASDATGGVWVGFGESGFRGPGGGLVRLDGTGTEVTRVTFPEPPAAGPNVIGVRALTALPDGRAVALLDARSFAVVTRDGAVTESSLGTGVLATSLLLTEEASSLIVLGTTSSNDAVVERRSFDGALEWSSTLASSTERARSDFASPRKLALADDRVYATWQASDGPRVAALRLTDGAELWSVGASLPSQVRPESVIADAEGVVFQGYNANGYLTALTAASGTARWSITTPEFRTLGSLPTFAPCGDGGTCLSLQAKVTAYEPDGSVRWEQTREGAPYPSTSTREIHTTTDGGALVVGDTYTDAGGRDALVAHISASGAVRWAVAVDGSGTSDDGYSFLPTADGGAVGAFAAFGPTGEASVYVVSLRPDGAQRWTRQVDPGTANGRAYVRGVVTTDDGGVALFVDVFPNANENTNGVGTATVVRYGADGTELWTTSLADPSEFLFSLGIVAVPEGFATVHYEFVLGDLRVDRLDGDGDPLGRVTLDNVGACEALGLNVSEPVAFDRNGGVYVALTPGNGPSACARPTIYRIGTSTPDGIGRFFGATSERIQAFDVRPNGTWGAVYGDGLLARFDARLDGSVTDGISLDMPEALFTDVVTGPDVQVLAAGYVETGSGPFLVSHSLSAGIEKTALPSPFGLRTRTTNAALSERAAYVSLTGSSDPINVASVVRVSDAIPVATGDRPGRGTPLTIIGANPVRAGGALRVRVGAPTRLTLYDALGRRLAAWPEAVGEVTLDMPVAAGVYLLRADDTGRSAAVQVSVVR